MRSSWQPPSRAVRPDLLASPVPEEDTYVEHDEPSATFFRQSEESVRDDNEARNDVMFGIPLDESIRIERPLAASASVQDSIASVDKSVIPEVLGRPDSILQHDAGYAVLFMLVLSSLFTSSLFIYLRTEAPTAPMGDTVYVALVGSMGTLVKHTTIALGVSILWLFTMRAFVKPLLQMLVVVVPIVLSSFAIYVLVWSYKGSYGGYELQAHAMRWSSFITTWFAALWLYTVYSRRSAIGRAVGIIKLAFTILEQNAYLLIINFSALLFFLVFTFLWILQFERIFLRGTMSGISGHRMWILQGDSWFLAAYFILVFLWTFGVVSGVQRSTISAVTSQWYFHRHDQPQTPAKAVAEAALWHALSASFGTICASSLFGLLTRLPLLIVPRRAAGTISLVAYMFLSAPLVNLTSPLTLTYASIFSTNLKTAARVMEAQPRLRPGKHWQPYQTAKMVLSAARATTALGLGLAAWIQAARRSGASSSLYGYIVGMIAGAVGWMVVGCVEGMVSVLVDACFVSWIVDADNTAAGRTHCQEANGVFGALSSTARGQGALQV
jgi:hypothetical protein